jgi:hypothetical protein
MDERDCLRLLISFKETLDGAVSLSSRVQVAAECAKVEVFLAGLERRKAFSEQAKLTRESLANFMERLPEFNNTDFVARRKVTDLLGKSITHAARLVAISNRLEKGRTE